jgi:hypothetical protein
VLANLAIPLKQIVAYKIRMHRIITFLKFKKILAKTLVSQILLISIINMQIIIAEVLQFKLRNLQLEEQIKEENFHQVEV